MGEEIIIYELTYSEKYFDDIDKHKKSGQKKILKKIDLLFDEVEKHPA